MLVQGIPCDIWGMLKGQQTPAVGLMFAVLVGLYRYCTIARRA